MKFSKWILAAAMALSAHTASVQAKDACSPCVVENTCDLCDISFCDVQYSGYVDALYWNVCKGDMWTEFDGGKVQYLEPEYNWGYRLGGIAHWRNWDLGLRWTSYKNDSSHDGFGFDLHYHVLDLELGYNCCMDCGPFAFRPFVGGKFAWIKDTFSDNDDFTSRIKNDAQGLYIGSSARWQLCNYQMCDKNIPIALVARASGGVMHSEFSQDIRGGEVDEDIGAHCIYNLYYDVYLALDFSYCGFCGTDLFFQIGYEAQSWDWVEYDSRGDDNVKFGLGGLVLRFGAEF